MALLEKINLMKQSGMSDPQIMTALKEEGNSPQEIAEAFSQLKIKSAVTIENQDNMEPSISSLNQEQINTSPMNQYSQVMAYNQGYPQQAQQNNLQQNQQSYAQEQYAPQYPQESYPQQAQQEYTDQTYAPQDQQNYYSGGLDIETVRDISKQEIEESLKKVKAQIDLLTQSKTEISFQVQNIENRLIKIETIIQELQTAIIRKMGDYGEAVSNISQELKETQKSFSKMVNPILDQRRNTQSKKSDEETPENNQETKINNNSRVSKKPTGSVEEYFR